MISGVPALSLATTRLLLACARPTASRQDMIDAQNALVALEENAAAAQIRAAEILWFGVTRQARTADAKAELQHELRQLAELEPDAEIPSERGSPGDVAGLCLTLAAQIVADPASVDLGSMRRTLDALALALPDQPELAIAPGAFGSLAEQVAATVTARALKRGTALAFAPYGSAALFHRAARFDPGLLGPYLTALDCFAEQAADILALARLAAGGDRMRAVRCLAIFSTMLDAERVAELGEFLLEATQHDSGNIGQDDLAAVCDAAIEKGVLLSALALQERLAHLPGASACDRRRLAYLEQKMGLHYRAHATLRAALRHAPGDAITRERLRTLRAAAALTSSIPLPTNKGL